jgi:thiol-disulfide isomerase/thioredoxin
MTPARKPTLSRRAALLFAALLTLLAPAAPQAAKPGDPAAALQIEHWAKGEAVDIAAGKGKTIYVLDFWATWCGPCMASIPEMTALQNKFRDKGVVLIGVNSSEDKETVDQFVKEQGDAVSYTIALDKEEKTSAGYMEAYGVNSIPHTFVIDKEGKMVWHGHPSEGLEDVVQGVVDGTFDPARIELRQKAMQLVQAYHTLSSSGEDDLAQPVYDRILKYAGDHAQTMLFLAFSSLGPEGTSTTHLKQARTALDLALKHEKQPDLRTQAANARLLRLEGKPEEAAKAEQAALDLAKTDEEKAAAKQIASEGLDAATQSVPAN